MGVFALCGGGMRADEMGIGPGVRGRRSCFSRTSMRSMTSDLWEMNEAFARAG